MKLEVLKENLERAASIAAKVSNKNLSLPVLGCVVISAETATVELRATNLDVSVVAPLKARVVDGGIAAVPAHTLAQTVSALTDAKLTIHTTGNNLIFEGEHGKTSLTLVDSSEFPKLPQVPKGGGADVTLPARELSRTVRMVAFSASVSNIKPELASVSLSLEKGELVAAATDSFRLAEARTTVKSKRSFPPVLIPSRNVADILRVVGEEGDVEVRIGDTQATFASEAGVATSRLVDGAFPDYQSIIPKDIVASATMLKEDAVKAFRKIAIFTDSFNQVHLSLCPSKKTFTVSALNASVGETLDRVPAALDGEDIEINFNARYITDALGIVSGDSVTFSVAGAGKPMLVSDVPHKGFTYLVMPMNR